MYKYSCQACEERLLEKNTVVKHCIDSYMMMFESSRKHKVKLSHWFASGETKIPIQDSLDISNRDEVFVKKLAQLMNSGCNFPYTESLN